MIKMIKFELHFTIGWRGRPSGPVKIFLGIS